MKNTVKNYTKTFMNIIRELFEKKYESIVCRTFNLLITDKYRTEEYTCTLWFKTDHSGYNFSVVNYETGEILLEVSITCCIIPTLSRYNYEIVYVSEDFNHTRRYAEGFYTIIHNIC